MMQMLLVKRSHFENSMLGKLGELGHSLKVLLCLQYLSLNCLWYPGEKREWLPLKQCPQDQSMPSGPGMNTAIPWRERQRHLGLRRRTVGLYLVSHQAGTSKSHGSSSPHGLHGPAGKPYQRRCTIPSPHLLPEWEDELGILSPSS